MVRDRLLCRAVTNNNKILFISGLNILTKWLLRWFASASEFEKMALNKLLNWLMMCHSPGATCILFPIAL